MPPVLSPPHDADCAIAAIAASTISPGTYVRIRRQALSLSLEDVALLLGSVPSIPAIRRVEWLASIEADVTPLSLPTIIALHDAIGIDLRILAYWMAVAEGIEPSLVDVMFAAGVEVPTGLDHAA